MAENWRGLDGEWHRSFSGRRITHLDDGHGVSVCAGKYYLQRVAAWSRKTVMKDGSACKRCLRVKPSNDIHGE